MQLLFDVDSISGKKAAPTRGKNTSPHASHAQASPPKLKPVSNGASLTALLSAISRDCGVSSP